MLDFGDDERWYTKKWNWWLGICAMLAVVLLYLATMKFNELQRLNDLCEELGGYYAVEARSCFDKQSKIPLGK
jgi:4-amino-4-deoxy-L-arabinose transferase-like glycosyltransferase